MKMILLNPGPVTLSARVRNAMLRDDLCHREPEFAALQNGIREKLLATYSLPETDWAIALITGSGTAAVESMLTSLVPRDGKLLIVENGVYGERMRRIAERYAIPYTSVTQPWQAAIDYTAVDAALAADTEISHIAVVHHETTTGRLNELAPLAEICDRHGVAVLLDAVSSFAAEAIPFESVPIAACAATANKCLHGVPGTCFVVSSRRALETAHPRNLYLDLGAYVSAQDNSGTPFTQSIQTFYALDEALDELLEGGGVEARRALYESRMATIRETLVTLGIEPLLDAAACSCVLHAYKLPSGIDYTTLHDALKKAGFVIYAGQGNYAQSIFRISMMGEISGADIGRLQQALTATLGT